MPSDTRPYEASDTRLNAKPSETREIIHDDRDAPDGPHVAPKHVHNIVCPLSSSAPIHWQEAQRSSEYSDVSVKEAFNVGPNEVLSHALYDGFCKGFNDAFDRAL